MGLRESPVSRKTSPLDAPAGAAAVACTAKPCPAIAGWFGASRAEPGDDRRGCCQSNAKLPLFSKC
jgi:hypothetical protein